MTQKIDIVLGSFFGDEGKGKVVDWLLSQNKEPTVVVRFSGGHNAGHTVVDEVGRHVHSSFPVGILRGQIGYISEHCVVSPLHMLNEWRHLKKQGREFD